MTLVLQVATCVVQVLILAAVTYVAVAQRRIAKRQSELDARLGYAERKLKFIPPAKSDRELMDEIRAEAGRG